MQIIKLLFWLYMLVLMAACTTTRSAPYYSSDLKRAALLNTELGAKYIERGRLDLAKEKLEKALEQDPDLPSAHVTYAWLQGLLGNAKSAEKHFNKALRASPHNPDFLNTYGRFLCNQGQIEQAEKRFMAALSDPLYKTPEYAYANAGECALKAKQHDKAESYLRKALQHNPRHPSSLYGMAQLGYVRGAYKLSHSYLTRYHELESHSPQSLALAIELARKLNDKNAQASYTLLLKNKFPDSREAQNLNARGN